jgi:hypothetical protein
MLSDKSRHPDSTEYIEAETQTHTRPTNWSAHKDVENSVINYRCGGRESYGSNNQHDRRSSRLRGKGCDLSFESHPLAQRSSDTVEHSGRGSPRA